MPGEQKTHWTEIRYERTENKASNGSEVTKSIRVTDCPLRITIEPWSEERRVIRSVREPADDGKPTTSNFPHYSGYEFDEGQAAGHVKLRLDSRSVSK
jgi:hypothetical protein